MNSPLARHPFFISYIDPASGAQSFILNERVAPSQAVIYFVNPAISADEKWLWFSCGYPPSPHKRLGVVSLDPDNPVIKVFQEATFHAETPLVMPGGDSCLFGSETSVYEIDVHGNLKTVVTIPNGILQDRPLARVSTHLTISADGKYVLIDGDYAAARWFIALGDLATGEVRQLKEFTYHMNHAQFSPVDPTLFSVAQDWWKDPVSGKFYPYDQRIWLMDTLGTLFEPLRPTDWNHHGSSACHEWWDKQGRMCWVDYAQGAMRCDVETRTVEHIWKRPLCHAHCSPDSLYWCADQNPYEWNTKPVDVLFFNSVTGNEIPIFAQMPKPPYPRSPLHLDPHPHFSPKGTYIASMTTVRGLVDVAVTPVEQLVERTG